MRAHRAYRQLSLLLSRTGFAVFRFDYYGTGDSAGASHQIDLAQWSDDLANAIEELKDTAQLEQVSLVGLRLGASLALEISKCRDDVHTVVLWDPIVDGAAYVRELLARGPVGEGPPVEGVRGAKGFPVPDIVRDAIARVDMRAAGELRARDIFLVVARQRADYAALHARLQNSGTPTTYACVAANDNWHESDDFGSVLLPQQIVRAIVDHLSRETAA
jgi:pimeloyl-ACP methyl ester carboxylesterase